MLLAHGSGGLTYKNYRFVARLAALGYAVFAPDSMALPRALGLRHRDAVTPLAAAAAAAGVGGYWSQALVYNSSCPWGAAAPFCYSSNATAYATDPAGYAEVVHRRIRLISHFAWRP